MEKNLGGDSMFSLLVNAFIFLGFIIILLIEFLFATLLNIDKTIPWLSTIIIFILFIVYQIILFLYNYFGLNKAKQILNDIILAVKGIPIVNEDEKIVIKWDLIFKDLIEIKEFALYDRIVKFKTKNIDLYVNQHPSILLDNSYMREYKYSKDLKSFITKKGDESEKESNFIVDDNFTKKLFISDISNHKVTFTNYNSSIIIDAILIDEYEPSNYEELGIDPNPLYDGFSVYMYYNNKKYSVIPRIVIYGKKINKSKWFYDNIKLLFQFAIRLAEEKQDYKYELSEDMLIDYTEEISQKILLDKPSILFHSLVENSLVFKSIDYDKEPNIIYCSLSTGYNSFEIMLNTIKKEKGNKSEILEINKTVAIGNSYDPIITILEKMPQIIKNIELLINNKDIKNIVF